ncbi:MAG: hypothetical protein ACR2F6_06860 [Mycobacteriales bacterium]
MEHDQGTKPAGNHRRSAPSEITKATNGRLVGLVGENVLASFGKDTIDFSDERAYFGN